MTFTPGPKRDLRTSRDLSQQDIAAILDLATDLKGKLKRGEPTPLMTGRGLAMIFEKPSLRTRSTFDLGIYQLGGHAVYLTQNEIGLGKRESVADVARNLERLFDMVTARVFAQSTVDELAQWCRVPVINALSDAEHPCQALADLLTLREATGNSNLAGFHLTYVGDGNNICHSLMQIGVKSGMHVTASAPSGYEPAAWAVEATNEAAKRSGGSYTYERDPRRAVARAQAIYTDVWASMGQESETRERARAFADYQVNEALVALAPSEAFIMHDLPAHRGEEITDGVLDGERSIVMDQAENRLHAQKGLMAFLWDASKTAR